MKLALFIAIVGVSCSTIGQVDKSQESLERTKDAPSVAEQLKGFENGSISLEKLTEDGGTPLRQEIIRYYTNNTNRVSVKMLLVVGRCFGLEYDSQSAAKLAESYVTVYTNDYRGWRLLGGACGMLGRNEQSLDAYRKATKLGDFHCYSSMAGVALELNRLDVVREILPQLLRLKDSKEIPAFIQIEIVGLLSLYARRADDKEVFIKALEGRNVEEILSQYDLAVSVDKTCQKFQSPEVEVLCQKIHEAVQRKAAEQKK